VLRCIFLSRDEALGSLRPGFSLIVLALDEDPPSGSGFGIGEDSLVVKGPMLGLGSIAPQPPAGSGLPPMGASSEWFSLFGSFMHFVLLCSGLRPVSRHRRRGGCMVRLLCLLLWFSYPVPDVGAPRLTKPLPGAKSLAGKKAPARRGAPPGRTRTRPTTRSPAVAAIKKRTSRAAMADAASPASSRWSTV
jgi:hypothetical protein